MKFNRVFYTFAWLLGFVSYSNASDSLLEGDTVNEKLAYAQTQFIDASFEVDIADYKALTGAGKTNLPQFTKARAHFQDLAKRINGLSEGLSLMVDTHSDNEAARQIVRPVNLEKYSDEYPDDFKSFHRDMKWPTLVLKFGIENGYKHLCEQFPKAMEKHKELES